MVADGVDVWKVGDEGTVDFRVSRDQFREMEKTLSGCKEAGSVEEIVRRAERMAAKQLTNRTRAAEWFEEYVSYLCLNVTSQFIVVAPFIQPKA